MKLFKSYKSDIAPLYIQPTNDSPGVRFDADKGKFELYGVSLPENVIEVYEPILKWLEDYRLKPNSKTVFNFNLDYLNTASTKVMDNLLNILNKIYISGYKVIVNWNYKHGDVDMYELGEELFLGYEFTSTINPMK